MQEILTFRQDSNHAAQELADRLNQHAEASTIRAAAKGEDVCVIAGNHAPADLISGLTTLISVIQWPFSAICGLRSKTHDAHRPHAPGAERVAAQ